MFNNPSSSDPTHSVLSKACRAFGVVEMPLTSEQDHFGIILNEPAGKVAKVVVEHSVNLVVEVCHMGALHVSTGILNFESEGLVKQFEPRRGHQQGT